MGKREQQRDRKKERQQTDRWIEAERQRCTERNWKAKRERQMQ